MKLILIKEAWINLCKFICIMIGICKISSPQDLLASIYHLSVITCEQYLTCTAIGANISTCILILVRCSCTKEHHKHYLWNVSRHIEVFYECLANSPFLKFGNTNLQMNRLVRRLLIVSTNLNGFSLVNHNLNNSTNLQIFSPPNLVYRFCVSEAEEKMMGLTNVINNTI